MINYNVLVPLSCWYYLCNDFSLNLDIRIIPTIEDTQQVTLKRRKEDCYNYKNRIILSNTNTTEWGTKYINNNDKMHIYIAPFIPMAQGLKETSQTKLPISLSIAYSSTILRTSITFERIWVEILQFKAIILEL